MAKTTLQLPEPQDILLNQLMQNEKLIRDLHPLLHLLDVPDHEDLNLMKMLLGTLKKVVETQSLCLQQQAATQEKIDRILDVLQLPLD